MYLMLALLAQMQIRKVEFHYMNITCSWTPVMLGPSPLTNPMPANMDGNCAKDDDHVHINGYPLEHELIYPDPYPYPPHHPLSHQHSHPRTLLSHHQPYQPVLYKQTFPKPIDRQLWHDKRPELFNHSPSIIFLSLAVKAHYATQADSTADTPSNFQDRRCPRCFYDSNVYFSCIKRMEIDYKKKHKLILWPFDPITYINDIN